MRKPTSAGTKLQQYPNCDPAGAAGKGIARRSHPSHLERMSETAAYPYTFMIMLPKTGQARRLQASKKTVTAIRQRPIIQFANEGGQRPENSLLGGKAAECAMPRFFFDVKSASGVIWQDYKGIECSDAVDALYRARHGAGFVTVAECERDPQLTQYEFSVTDEDHHFLVTVPFANLRPRE